jgi:hypothetical protein
VLTPRLLDILDLQAVAPGPPLAGALHELADFIAIDQVQDSWCWAAVAAMVYRHYSGTLLDPCKWATICMTPNQCCKKPGSCDAAFPIESALRGMLHQPGSGPLGVAAIEAEIVARPQGRPIVCVQRTAAHVVVIYGIDETAPGQTFILSVDPAGGYFNRDEIQAFTFSDPGWSWTVFTQPGGP